MSSLNSCSFIGNLGADPEVRSTQGGDKVVNLKIACSEKWKNKNGERQERTTWVPVIIWGPLAGIAEQYLRKGSKVFVQGKFSVRKWSDRDGQDRWATEIVLQGPQAQMVMLDAPQGNAGNSSRREPDGSRGAPADEWGGSGGFAGDIDDDIPFISDRSIF